ncbi:hypothetical protein ACWGLF_12070 [Streptomyces puniciscabiei]
MTAAGPVGVSMHDLLASCEAADAISTPPRAPEERPEGAATTDPQTNDGDPARHPDAA